MFRVPIDGLWRCLCPSIDAKSVSLLYCFPQKLFPRTSVSKCLRKSHLHIQRNSLYSIKSIHTLPPSNVEQVLEFEDFSLKPLHKYDTSQLYDVLNNFESGKIEACKRIYEIVEHIITIRGEKPNTLHYVAMIRANASAILGSADSVRELLAEMDEFGIEKDLQVYHAALLALTVHPDYILRMEILSEMKKLWIGLTSDGWHHLVLGLIRDRQYEMAMEKLEQMIRDQVTVKPWLFDIFMYQLCESEEYDEALAMLKYRWHHGRKIKSELWQFLMDAFGKGLHYEGLKFIWLHQVGPGNLIPSDGVLSAVLNAAARHSDAHLATSATRILSRRSAVEPYHYEALMEAYARAKDLKLAFRVLSVMEKAGLNPDASNTRPLFAYLSSDPEIPSSAWEVLIKLHADGQKIPLTAINVVIEACVRLRNIDLAMLFYKRIHTISSGPNTATFNHLLQGLSKTTTSAKAIAMFLASEMSSLEVTPDNITYDRLILICIREKDYEDAFQYLDEMIHEGFGKNEGKGWWMRQGTAERCVTTTLSVGDPRGWDIIATMERKGMDVSLLKQWAMNKWKSLPNEVKKKKKKTLSLPRDMISSLEF
ncbi:hypothetical protein K3495_g5280 [Podosphaera aphanis]|nr:hypothetical protein K3495_g5280 [Podosphaera aphanis]